VLYYTITPIFKKVNPLLANILIKLPILATQRSRQKSRALSRKRNKACFHFATQQAADFQRAMRAVAQCFMRLMLSALATSDSAPGWRPDKVRFLLRLRRFF